jgi:hypothetical protein
MNEGITATIPNELKCWHLEAIRWMEREYLAYLPALQRGQGFGRTDHYIVKNKKHFAVSFDEPFGLLKVDKIYTEPPQDLNKYKSATYCNLGVMAFMHYYLDNVPIIKYNNEHYGKHPLSMLAFGCNKTQALIDSGRFAGNAKQYGIKIDLLSNLLDAAREAHHGNLVFALWANPKGIGHMTTMTGGKETGYAYDFGHPMTYNIGSKNGYMSLENAFCKTEGKNINYYIVSKL